MLNSTSGKTYLYFILLTFHAENSCLKLKYSASISFIFVLLSGNKKSFTKVFREKISKSIVKILNILKFYVFCSRN